MSWSLRVTLYHVQVGLAVLFVLLLVGVVAAIMSAA